MLFWTSHFSLVCTFFDLVSIFWLDSTLKIDHALMEKLTVAFLAAVFEQFMTHSAVLGFALLLVCHRLKCSCLRVLELNEEFTKIQHITAKKCK